jgi:hypothetical protein
MVNSKHSSDTRTPAPAGADAGPQSDPGGAGGEPKGTRLQAQRHAQSAASTSVKAAGGPQPEHSSHKEQPGYRARPAGQSGLGKQDDRASTIDEPQGDGNYVATDRGDQPLRNG